MYVLSGSPGKSPVILFPALCIAALVAVLALGVGNSHADARSSGNLIFILDASGSMGAKIQGKLKMDVAKEALSGLIKNLPSGIKVGLVAYGHRQKGDCNDVEELAPLGPLGKEALITMVKNLGYKGMTPIASSVQKVAEGLRTLEEETTIILVSDGEETCGGDPCALVKELKASGINFVMHVIGFDVGDKEKAQLSCIAEAGGGSYFSAKNAGELGVAAQKAVQKTEQSAGKLKVTALRNGKPVRAYCAIFKPASEDADKEREKVDEGWIDPTGTQFKLTPGVYDLEVQYEEDATRPTVKFTAVAIELGKNVDKVADFSGGSLKVKALRNGKPFRAYCEVYRPAADSDGDKEKVAEGWIEPEGTSFKLTPGVYDVQVINEEDSGRPTVSFAAIAIEAGKSIEKSADFSGGTLKVKSLRNGKHTRAYCEVYSKGTGEDEEKEQEKVAEGWVEAEGTAFKLIPGVYDIKVKNEEDSNGTAVIIKEVPVEAGKSVERLAEFSGGTLKVKSTRNGKPLRTYCEIYTTDTAEDKEKEKAGEGWVESEGTAFKLITATYDVVVLWNDNEVKKEFKGVTIEAGKVQTLDTQF